MLSQPKLIYLVRRNPALSRDAFTARWREHAMVGMSLPRWCNIARYVHVDGVAPTDAERDVLASHDAIGMVWHKSPAHRAAHLADRGSRTAMERDEIACFASPIVTCCLVAEEQVLRVATQEAAWKLTAFLAEPDPACSLLAALGHVRNLPLSPQRPGGWGLNSAQIDEWLFADRASAVRGARSLHLDARALLVLGREVELYRA